MESVEVEDENTRIVLEAAAANNLAAAENAEAKANLALLELSGGGTDIEAVRCLYEETEIAELTVPEGITKIAKRVFSERNVATLNLSSTVEEIGDNAFYLKDIGRSTTLAQYACANSLSNIVFAENGSLKVIGEGVLNGLTVDKLIIPEGVTTISKFALGTGYSGGLSRTRKFVLPKTLTNLSLSAFAYYEQGTGSVPAVWTPAAPLYPLDITFQGKTKAEFLEAHSGLLDVLSFSTIIRFDDDAIAIVPQTLELDFLGLYFLTPSYSEKTEVSDIESGSEYFVKTSSGSFRINKDADDEGVFIVFADESVLVNPEVKEVKFLNLSDTGDTFDANGVELSFTSPAALSDYVTTATTAKVVVRTRFDGQVDLTEIYCGPQSSPTLFNIIV